MQLTSPLHRTDTADRSGPAREVARRSQCDERLLRHHSSRLRSGFTLIELLVAISIIALLIALLLPALSAARAAADASVCLSSQRQVYIAMSLYNEDDGRLPPPIFTVPNPGAGPGTLYIRYNQALMLYMDGTQNSITFSNQGSGFNGAFPCPTTLRIEENRSAPVFGLNRRLGPDKWEEPADLFTLRQPSSLYLVGDIGPDTGYLIWPENDQVRFDRWQIHGSSANILFADGHARSGKYELRVGGRPPWDAE
ncbi:MAG: prepilin-type N-terminal cleavage/methylation domain-containing protein [Phycisphaeraceae bacterium]